MTDKIIISNEIITKLEKYIPNFSQVNLRQISLFKGLTNKFLEYKDLQDIYLLRLNGRLWHPFTREMEQDNLVALFKNQISTDVIYNDVKLGFQLCTKRLGAKRLVDISDEDERIVYLAKLGELIKKYQKIRTGFDNNYAMHQTIHCCLQKKSGTNYKLNHISEVIYQLLLALYADTSNFVPSHNDLLPSSIIISKADIAIVDWEYSSTSHRVIDSAYLSATAALTAKEEDALLNSQDSNDKYNSRKYFSLAKPVVVFMLLLWSKDKQETLTLYSLLINSVGQAMQKISLSERCLFFNSKPAHQSCEELRNEEEQGFVMPAN